MKASENPQSVLTHLPVEIIFEILKRLPVESLLLLRSVCKLWCSVISDPNFVKSHLSHSTTNINNRSYYAHHRLIFSTRTTSTFCMKSCPLYNVVYDGGSFNNNTIELDCPLEHVSSIKGSCNGLLLIDNYKDYLFIWNPITGTSKRVPHFCSEGRIGCEVYGFGYDESTDDYKVVGTYGGSTDIMNIYSLKTGNWKRIGASHDIYNWGDNVTYVNGALHWMVFLDSGWSRSLTIVSLDLAKETYGEILKPVDADAGVHTDLALNLGVVGEWLCVLCDYRWIRADVWVMKVYGVKDSWTKLVSLPHLIGYTSHMFSVPLIILNDGKVLLRYCFKLFVYDPKSCSFSEIQNFDECSKAIFIVGSLVLPDSPAGVTRYED